MLNPIKAAAGSTMASSNFRSVRVRSVSRHFLNILGFSRLFFLPANIETIEAQEAHCVKESQTIVKSCKEAPSSPGRETPPSTDTYLSGKRV